MTALRLLLLPAILLSAGAARTPKPAEIPAAMAGFAQRPAYLVWPAAAERPGLWIYQVVRVEAVGTLP